MRDNDNKRRNPEDEQQDENWNHGDHSNIRLYSEDMGAKSFMARMKSYLHLERHEVERSLSEAQVRQNSKDINDVKKLRLDDLSGVENHRERTP